MLRDAQDPLSAYAMPARVTGTQIPVPLVATKIAVEISGLLATVTTSRHFLNAEARSIEATITFPLPVHATLLSLTARIGERHVVGVAQRREAARQTYEAAIDDGRTAILHEEALRGIHMISVGHVPPGAEMIVTCIWAMPLSVAGTAMALRIPVTVGDVYGRSPLADGDDLAHGAALQEADLEVSCPGARARLVGHGPLTGVFRVRLDAPIELLFDGAAGGRLAGMAADGRSVTLDIGPAGAGEVAIDAAIVSDRSGSMAAPAGGFSGGGRVPTKLETIRAALASVAADLSGGDRVDLWEFDNDAEPVAGATFAQAVGNMGGPRGGTAIGSSLRRVLAHREIRDVLLITDGKSHDIDVQALAATGCRFTIVLVGEDSLEAQVGHLAALTGGQIFLTIGAYAGDAIRQAFAAMRLAKAAAPRIAGAPMVAEALIGGMRVRALWQDAPGDRNVFRDVLSRSVAAVAATLAIPRMIESEAASLAAAEGIVCHLTSLVLVDEAGARQEGLPAQRKVATMTPRTVLAGAAMAPMAGASPVAASPVAASPAGASQAAPRMAAPMAAPMPIPMPSPAASLVALKKAGKVRFMINRLRPRQPTEATPPPLKNFKGREIEFGRDPDALLRGDLTGIHPVFAGALAAAAAHPLVIALAARVGTAALIVVIALVARLEADDDRTAARIARSVLGSVDDETLDAVSVALGL